MTEFSAKTPTPRSDLLKRQVGIAVLGPVVTALIIKYLNRITLFQKMLFLDHLRIMIKGGLSIIEALGVLGRETTNAKFKAAIEEVKKDVEQGEPLSVALSRHPKIFSPMYVRMIEAGETAGQLESSLEQAVIQMRKAYELTSSIKGAMIYPGVILTAMVGIGIMMVTVVLPQLTALFKEMDAELPLATRILISISDVASQPVMMAGILVLITFCIGGYISLLKRVPTFRASVHSLTLHLPIAGNIIKQINLARFSLTLSSLLKSTIPVVDAVNITADTCSNVQYQTALHEASELVKRGTPLSEILQKFPNLFPPMVVEMILVGEQSGDVEALLTELANFYNDEVNKTMKNFTTIIEPVIIITIGIAVAGMAVAVIMPMFSLAQQF